MNGYKNTLYGHDSLANSNNDQRWDDHSEFTLLVVPLASTVFEIQSVSKSSHTLKICADLDSDLFSNTVDTDVNGTNVYPLSTDHSNKRLSVKHVGFVIDQQFFIGLVVAHLHDDKLRCSTDGSVRLCYRVQILAPCVKEIAPKTSRLEQFLESLFIIQPDIFVAIDSSIVVVLNIHVLPDGRLDPSSKSELREFLLAESRATKRKFGPAKDESDSMARNLSRGLNDKILRQSRPDSTTCEEEPVANIFQHCRQTTDSGRASLVVVSPVVVDEYSLEESASGSVSPPDRDRLAPSQSNPSRPSSSSPSWSVGDIVVVVVDRLDELILCRVVGPEKPCFGDPQLSCWRVQVFAAVGRPELANNDSSRSRALAESERFVHAVFCIQHDLFLTVQAPHVVISGIHLESGGCLDHASRNKVSKFIEVAYPDR